MSTRLNVWLYRNLLTDDPNDYVGQIESPGTFTVDDIIEELRKEGMDIKAETAKAVIDRFNSRCIDRLLEGYHIHTGLVQMHLSVKGVFHDHTWNPDKHRIHVAIAPSVGIRNAVTDTIVVIAGDRPTPMNIFSITDTSTGKTDGSLTANHVAEIKGSYIKIVGTNVNCGLFLRDLTTSTNYQVPPANIAVNNPSRILFSVPALDTTNKLELSITTQFTNGRKELEHPRTAICPIEVSIS